MAVRVRRVRLGDAGLKVGEEEEEKECREEGEVVVSDG